MNVGRAITEGMRADRKRQLGELLRADRHRHHDRLLAWCWWGWNLNGVGGLGYPGLEIGQHRQLRPIAVSYGAAP